MRMAARLEAMGTEKYSGLTRKSGGRAKWTGKLFLDWKSLSIPASWAKPRRVFVNSMSDLFHVDVPVEFIAAVWQVMADTPRHTYQILTKRPDRMAEVLAGGGFAILPNVWLGCRSRIHAFSIAWTISGAYRLRSASSPSSR